MNILDEVSVVLRSKRDTALLHDSAQGLEKCWITISLSVFRALGSYEIFETCFESEGFHHLSQRLMAYLERNNMKC